MAKAGNTSLGDAKKAKKDEFYTQLADIEREVCHYWAHFNGKTVLCNCDDPRVSNFFHYFSYKFEDLGLKRLIATCYKNQELDLFSQNVSERAIWLEYTGDKNGNRIPDPEEIGIRYLNGDGDFRSEECIELLKQADIVVTNPPFSLFREYVAQLIKYGKKFIIIGRQDAVTYKEIFPLIMSNQIWLGHGFAGGNAYFSIPRKDVRDFAHGVYDSGTGLVKFRNCTWFTNLDHKKRHEDIVLYRKYNPTDYPTLDNYNAINISATVDIPEDYYGDMAVPVTFLDKYNPDQFEIVGITKTWFGAATKTYPKQIQVDANGKRSEVTKLNDGAVLKLQEPPKGKTYYLVDGIPYVQLYPRIIIRRRQQEVGQ